MKAIPVLVLAAVALTICATIVAIAFRHRVWFHTVCSWRGPEGQRELSSEAHVTSKAEARAWLGLYIDVLKEHQDKGN